MLPNGVYGHADDERTLENPGRDTVIPVFYMEKILDKKKSEAAGRSVFNEYEAARFIIPGDNTFEHRERLTEEHKRRWPSRYAQFKEGLEQTNGMPLEAWYKLNNHPGLLEEMKAMKIRSVEDLATITDDTAGRTGWGHEWKKHAKAEVEARKNKEAMAEVNSELQAKVDAQAEQMRLMSEQLAALQATQNGGEPKRGPGRPPNPKD